jgi:hypothetical protein
VVQSITELPNHVKYAELILYWQTTVVLALLSQESPYHNGASSEE